MRTDVFNAEVPRREGLMRGGVGDCSGGGDSNQILKPWVAGVLRDNPHGFGRVRESDKPTEGAEVLRLRIGGDHDQSRDRLFTDETEAIDRTICRSLCATDCDFSEFRDSWGSLRTEGLEHLYGDGRFDIQPAFLIVKILLDTSRCDAFGEDADQPLRGAVIGVERYAADDSGQIIRSEGTESIAVFVFGRSWRPLLQAGGREPLCQGAAMILRRVFAKPRPADSDGEQRAHEEDAFPACEHKRRVT